VRPFVCEKGEGEVAIEGSRGVWGREEGYGGGLRGKLSCERHVEDAMKTLVCLVSFSLLLLVVDASSVHAQSEADAIGSAAAPAASVTSIRRVAPKYTDESIGFEFEYKVDDAAVCVAWPEKLQDSGCDGLGYHNLVAYASALNAAKGRPVIRSMAYLRFDNNSTATISVGHVPYNRTIISQEIIDDLLDELPVLIRAACAISRSFRRNRWRPNTCVEGLPSSQ
jgi:hypothetical protein